MDRMSKSGSSWSIRASSARTARVTPAGFAAGLDGEEVAPLHVLHIGEIVGAKHGLFFLNASFFLKTVDGPHAKRDRGGERRGGDAEVDGCCHTYLFTKQEADLQKFVLSAC